MFFGFKALVRNMRMEIPRWRDDIGRRMDLYKI
jgi:hypothetical protein